VDDAAAVDATNDETNAYNANADIIDVDISNGDVNTNQTIGTTNLINTTNNITNTKISIGAVQTHKKTNKVILFLKLLF
jgi:hypothetical protein